VTCKIAARRYQFEVSRIQTRADKLLQVVELEIQLDDIKEQYSNVIRNSNSKAQQKKMMFLERNLEQLTVVQKQLVDQNSALKKEAGIAERKLLARNERIHNLEALLQEADRRLTAQNHRFEAQIQIIKQRLDEARGLTLESSAGTQVILTLRCSKRGKQTVRRVITQFRPNRQTPSWRWRQRPSPFNAACCPGYILSRSQSPWPITSGGRRVSCSCSNLTSLFLLPSALDLRSGTCRCCLADAFTNSADLIHSQAGFVVL